MDSISGFGKSKPKLEPDDGDIVEASPNGRYVRYNEILGRGACKIVYKGFDEVDGIEVAWNQISLDQACRTKEHLERIHSEVHLLKTLKHENIIKSHCSWVDEDKKTINMIAELLTSGSLRQYRRKHKSVDVKAIKNWARQILRGLQYLHSHNPPIIHRDLKCDNIFVNGNTGEIKIGDLGLAIIMERPTASSVIGTPEFMAPELYEEEYNELVDIYSFGMCMLELVTCEYPYSECKNPAQIFKKVTSGVKPAALGKVEDLQVKQFIEKCIDPAHLRLCASELLEDSFFLSENPKKSPQIHSYTPKPEELPKADSVTMEIDSEHHQHSDITFAKGSGETTHVSAVELRRSNGKYEFILEADMNNDDLIVFSLRIFASWGLLKNVHFEFDLVSDTAVKISSEMVDQFVVESEDLNFVAELIDSLILELVPGWMPSFQYSGQAIFKLENNEAEHLNIDRSSGSNGSGFESCEDGGSGSVVMNEVVKSSEVSFSCDAFSNDFGSLSVGTQYLGDGDQHDGLKMELDAIDMEYCQQFRELIRMREEAIENAKKKWITRKKMAIS